jgi:hypothetical protein
MNDPNYGLQTEPVDKKEFRREFDRRITWIIGWGFAKGLLIAIAVVLALVFVGMGVNSAITGTAACEFTPCSQVPFHED